jgi:hypothetical protein
MGEEIFGIKNMNKDEWKDAIDENRPGLGYFLSLSGRVEFKPSDYMVFRKQNLSFAQQILPVEWAEWML